VPERSLYFICRAEECREGVPNRCSTVCLRMHSPLEGAGFEPSVPQ
jgi:hypothetical protein